LRFHANIHGYKYSLHSGLFQGTFEFNPPFRIPIGNDNSFIVASKFPHDPPADTVCTSRN
jgi:hypothetical protein